MTTRAYNISELGLMRLEDLMREMQKIAERQIFEAGGTMPYRFGSLFYDLHQPGAQLTIPIKTYAASVVGRLLDLHYFDEDVILEKIIYVDALQSYVEFFYSYKREAKYKPSSDVSICLINPFHGMTMPDGTPRTSCTREEFETWSKELDA